MFLDHRIAPLKAFVLNILIAFFLLTECSHKKDEKMSAEESYIRAYKLMSDHSYEEAATVFEKIEDDFPASKWAIKAHTMAVYGYFKKEEYAKVVQNVEEFARSHPDSEFMPYMLYMKALSYYLRIPDIERSQDETQKASYGFRELIARFPSDEHAQDAEEKLEFVDEHLAGAKLALARYQMKTRNYVGAIKNLEELITRYRSSKQVPEGLFRMAEIYYKLGIKNLADKTLKNLRRTYPASYWAKLDLKGLDDDFYNKTN